MNPKKIFVAYHCNINSPLLEKSLKEKNYSVEKKHYKGVKILRYVLRQKPEICILKSNYEDLSGLDIVKEAYLKRSNTKFIIVFNAASEIDVIMAKRLNVSGCIGTKDPIEDILTCLDRVHNDDHYFSKDILQKMDQEKLNSFTEFTLFERKIIGYIGFYQSPERLAKKLNVAITTINQQVEIIKVKLSLKDEEPLHLWAANNTNFIESLLLAEVP